MIWYALHPQFTMEHLGYIPSFLDDRNPKPAKEQLDQNYRHGGGWRPTRSKLRLGEDGFLHFPGDPPVMPLARTILHADGPKPETIIYFMHDWVAIVQEDGSYEIARMD